MSRPTSSFALDSNLRQRLITSVLALPPVLLAVWFGGVAFAMLIGAIALISVLEMRHMLRGQPILFLGSLIYILGPLGLMIVLRWGGDGPFWIGAVIALTWVTDAFSYIGGRLWGRTPLNRAISPHKTLEGAITGWIAGGLAMIGVLVWAQSASGAALLMPLIGPWMAVAGDLFESAIKRRAGVKDSHLPGLNILPGHGGMLDRIDGLLFVAAFCALCAALGLAPISP